METVTLNAVVNELLDQLIPEGPMPDCYDHRDNAIWRIGFDTKNLMAAKTARLCKLFASLSSHNLGDEEVASSFFEEATMDAKAILINGFLRDLMCLLLQAQKKASAEVEKKTGPRPVIVND